MSSSDCGWLTKRLISYPVYKYCLFRLQKGMHLSKCLNTAELLIWPAKQQTVIYCKGKKMCLEVLHQCIDPRYWELLTSILLMHNGPAITTSTVSIRDHKTCITLLQTAGDILIILKCFSPIVLFKQRGLLFKMIETL